jgi:hypothetical protein
MDLRKSKKEAPRQLLEQGPSLRIRNKEFNLITANKRSNKLKKLLKRKDVADSELINLIILCIALHK